MTLSVAAEGRGRAVQPAQEEPVCVSSWGADGRSVRQALGHAVLRHQRSVGGSGEFFLCDGGTVYDVVKNKS